MRFPERRFSIPFCIFEDDLPDPALRVLLVLLSKSDFRGVCSASYADFRKGGVLADNTITKAIHTLSKKGWILFRKRTYGRPQVFWIKIPDRYKVQKKVPAVPISIIK